MSRIIDIQRNLAFSRTITPSNWLLCCITSLLISAPASSQTVIIGLPADQGATNCIPFGCAVERYQQVYNKNLFPSAILINEISFFGSGFVNTARYTIRLSTTTKAVNSLDIVELSNNIGADNSLFFSGILGGILMGDPPESIKFTITGSGFLYDPSEGNLLLDLSITDGVNFGESTFASRNGTFGDDSSRAYSTGGGFSGGYESYGLVTEFSTTSTRVPESSSTFGVLAFSALAANSTLKRRQQQKAITKFQEFNSP